MTSVYSYVAREYILSFDLFLFHVHIHYMAYLLPQAFPFLFLSELFSLEFWEIKGKFNLGLCGMKMHSFHNEEG